MAEDTSHRANFAIMRRLKRPLFTLVAVVLGLALLEGLLSFCWLAPDYAARRAALRRAVPMQEDFHAEHDADLGWRHIPGKKVVDLYGPGRSITINRDGLRGREDYVGKKPEDRFRVVCLGDSFTLGFGVDDVATYPAQLEQINPRVQAVNMGQGAYSIGQIYLWYQRDGARLEPDALVVAFILDDISRMSEVRMPNGAAMPLFALEDDKLRVSGQPVPKKIATGEPIDLSGGLLGFLFERSAVFRTVGLVVEPVRRHRTNFDWNSELPVAMAILRELHRAAHDVPLVVALLPTMSELTDPTQAEKYRQIEIVLAEYSRSAGIRFFDLAADFRFAAKTSQLYLDEPWHHPSEAGQRLIAERINAILGQFVPGYPQQTTNAPLVPAK